MVCRALMKTNVPELLALPGGALFFVLGVTVLVAQDPASTAASPKSPDVPELSVSAPLEDAAAKPAAKVESVGSSDKGDGGLIRADLPKSHPLTRYAALLEKSPFAVATAAPEAPPPAENFSTNFVVTGLSKNRGADGKEVHTVFVRSRDLSTRLVLTGDKPSDEGISVVSVEEAPVAAKSVVVLKKGQETGRVEFDHAALASTAGAGPPPSGAPAPAGKSAVPGGKAGTSPAARPAIPRPGMSGVPRPGASLNPPAPSATAPQASGATPGTAAGQELRRRVRPIQGAPGPGSGPEPQ
jgi:hypothetical protein